MIIAKIFRICFRSYVYAKGTCFYIYYIGRDGNAASSVNKFRSFPIKGLSEISNKLMSMLYGHLGTHIYGIITVVA